MKRLLLLFAALQLVACATEAGYREIVESWVGRKEADLVASVWGPPERIYEIPGGLRILTYSNTQSSAPIVPSVMIGSSGTSISTAIGAGGGGEDRFCETNFTVEGGFVTDVSFNGNDCVA